MIITKKILGRMNALNRRRSLIGSGDRVLVALSGGPDSVALTHLLCLWRRKYGLKLAAAHLHHGLSPQNERALRLARATAVRLGLPFYFKKVRVAALARKHRLTLEEAGREARYSFFTEVCKKNRLSKIATAHTQDDQAETVLMWIIRGCGLNGLAGIPAKRAAGKLQVVRPLLNCSKADLFLFLKQNGLRFQVDRSNRSPRFTRNRLRHELLPWIEKNLNPSIRETLAVLAERVRT